VRFLLKLAVALAMGAVCVALVVRHMDGRATWEAMRAVSPLSILLYVLTLAATHTLRALRWEHLLRPIGVSLPRARLFAISSVGFMAILLLPVRLGEFVRPYFIVRSGRSRMSAVLGTVAVERIVDGLVISMIFFGSYAASDGAAWPRELQVAAWLSMLGFTAAAIFLVCALRWTDRTIKLALAVSLLPRLAPRLSEKLADKLGALIQGFRVLREPRSLLPFLLQTAAYWGMNGFGMWVLARGLHLPIAPVAAFASMSFTGVLITLPNAPGLVGQFHLGIVLGLGAYLPQAVVHSVGIAYATLLHGIQVLWYAGVGFLCLPFVPGGRGSLRAAVIESNRAAGAEAPVGRTGVG
jgi:uncharacterized protein (TIRG00374 family)